MTLTVYICPVCGSHDLIENYCFHGEPVECERRVFEEIAPVPRARMVSNTTAAIGPGLFKRFAPSLAERHTDRGEG